MSIDLNLRTGNPNLQPTFIEWQFTKVDIGSATVCFGGHRAAFQVTEWNVFVEVVKQLAPSRWRSNKRIPELTENEPARAILRSCENTPSFQLMLAGIDIVQAFKLMENRSADDSICDFDNRNHTIRSVFGTGRIYFVPSTLTADVPRELLEHLLKQNKLGEAKLSSQEDSIRYYIPYSVPSTLQQAMPPEANRLWDDIRNEYYAYRHPLSAVPE
ncbi:MAG TPA: hypothetical protein VG097_05255 [Gemmata sp.]|jgi:hypothetical protein|nr:hypothetical protein [Gemmata sp.]